MTDDTFTPAEQKALEEVHGKLANASLEAQIAWMEVYVQEDAAQDEPHPGNQYACTMHKAILRSLRELQRRAAVTVGDEHG